MEVNKSRKISGQK